MNAETGKTIAAGFALSGFAVAVVSGLAVDNPVTRVLQCALVALVVCYLAGLAIGSVAARIASDHVAAYKAANPVAGAGRASAERIHESGAQAP